MTFARHALIATTILLPGCALQESLNRHQSTTLDTVQTSAKKISRFKAIAADRQVRRDAQVVNKPWIAGRAVPLAREASLPKALQRNVNSTLLFGQLKFNLPALAERLSAAIDLPVRISPEALLPPDHFTPRLSSYPSVDQGAANSEASFPLGTQPLVKILDVIARRLNIYWRFDSGALVFYRTQTQVFDVRLLSASASVEMSLGRSTSSGSGGFDSSARTLVKSSEHNVLDSVKAKIEPFLTRAGLVTAQPGADSSIVVTDIPESLSKIAEFIQRENRALTRRIRLVFEELTVETEDRKALSLDWSANILADAVSLSAKGPSDSSPDTENHAALSFRTGVSSPVKLLMQALSRQGHVIRHSTIPIMTINRRPVTHAVRTTFSYVDQVKTTASATHEVTHGSSAQGSVSVSQKEETVGAFLTILPDAQDDGQILISIAYDNTVAQPLKTMSFGGADKNLSIQQIVIDGNGTVQQLAMKSGQAMLISGFEQVRAQSVQSSVSPEISPLVGGSERVGNNKTITLIVLTALLEEN